jgi:hypothetical protein
MTTKELIAEIETRLQIVLTISIFFPVLMSTYFAITGASQKLQNEAFIFFPLVGLYILSYVFFEFSKLLPPLRPALKVLNWALLLGIACFALPILITVVSQGPLTFSDQFSFQINVWALIGSMAGITGLPFGILLFTVALLLLEMFAAVFKRLANKKIF